MDLVGLDALVVNANFDVVVVGGGGSGAVAAIEAADLGASVAIFEKASSPGGSTAVSGGSIRLVKDPLRAVDHLVQLSQGGTPRDVVTAFVDGMAEVPRWIEARGGKLEPWNDEGVIGEYFPVGGPPQYRHLPLTSSIDARAHMSPTEQGLRGGAAVWAFLEHNLAARGVPVICGARVTRLIERFPDRAVTGVEVAISGHTVTVRSKAVILACGGFSQDGALKREYFGLDIPSFSPPGRAEGDGVRLAQDVGADLWHMAAPAYGLGFASPGRDVVVRVSMSDNGFILVDQQGLRYECETELEAYSAARAMMVPDRTTGEYLRSPSFVIFDEVTRLAGRIGPATRWSADNTAEVERGWIHSGDSLEGLAAAADLPADLLAASVSTFNRAATTGQPDAFGRPAERRRPIDQPPFYALPVVPTLVNTQGGPRRNASGQIVRPDGSPIPGLFGAGELGSVWNRLYPSGGNIAECFVSGVLAARAAVAAETPMSAAR